MFSKTMDVDLQKNIGIFFPFKNTTNAVDKFCKSVVFYKPSFFLINNQAYVLCMFIFWYMGGIKL